MSTMATLISRDASRFDPIYGDTRHRVAPRLRRRRARALVQTAPATITVTDVRRFMTSFAGGLLFFSILIF